MNDFKSDLKWRQEGISNLTFFPPCSRSSASLYIPRCLVSLPVPKSVNSTKLWERQWHCKWCWVLLLSMCWFDTNSLFLLSSWGDGAPEQTAERLSLAPIWASYRTTQVEDLVNSILLWVYLKLHFFLITSKDCGAVFRSRSEPCIEFLFQIVATK